MNVDAADSTQEVANNDTEMQAAFAASFDSQPIAETPTTAEPEAEIKTEEKPEETATPPAPPAAPALSDDQVKLLSAIPELERRLTQQVDRVAGNYGEMKRLLESMQKAATTSQGAAAFEASEDGDYIAREFPEFSQDVDSRIKQAVSKVPTGITTDQFEAMLTERETKKRDELITILETAHPDRFQILESAAWAKWLEGLDSHQQISVMQSDDPYYVSGMISKFKKYRDTQTSASEKSKQRIANAVTPSGVRPTSPSTISESDAEQQAFEAQFK